MGITKGLAFFSVMFIGLGLLATVIYQSGVIQSLEQVPQQLLSNEVMKKPIQKDSHKTSQKIKEDRSEPMLSNPNGTIAIAIIRPKPTLENIILDALESDSFEVKF